MGEGDVQGGVGILVHSEEVGQFEDEAGHHAHPWISRFASALADDCLGQGVLAAGAASGDVTVHGVEDGGALGVDRGPGRQASAVRRLLE